MTNYIDTMKVGDVAILQYWHRFKPPPPGWSKVYEFTDDSALWRAAILIADEEEKLKHLAVNATKTGVD